MKQARPSHIGEVLNASNLPLRARLFDYKIQTSWPKVVGEHLSKRSSPLKLLKKTLYVTVSSQAWMTEFQYQKAEIMERLNSLFEDADPIADIIFKPGKITKSVQYKVKAKAAAKPEALRELTSERKGFIEKTVASVKDKELRELISRTMARSDE